MIDSPRKLLGLWPAEGNLAADEVVAKDIGASVPAVRKWAQRGRIPVAYWSPLVSAASRRRIRGVSLAALATMHARRPVASSRKLARAEARA